MSISFYACVGRRADARCGLAGLPKGMSKNSVSAAPLFLLGVLVLAAPGAAEPCSSQDTTSLRGRVTVFEPNRPDGPGTRGVGEVFVTAYGRAAEGTVGLSAPVSVTDPDGNFCVHEPPTGDVVLTMVEPFTFRPAVRVYSCPLGGCELGDVRIDESAIRVSDDFAEGIAQREWSGDTLAQTITLPPGALQVVKVTFRADGAGGAFHARVHQGGVTGPVVGAGNFRIGDRGGRDTAMLLGPARMLDGTGGEFTLVTEVASGTGWAPYLMPNDVFAGTLFTVAGAGDVQERPGQDLCFNLDVDGIDGHVTSLLATNNTGYVPAHQLDQVFVARSRAITHASVYSGSPNGFRQVQASLIDDATGMQIGPTREMRGLQDQGVSFAWFEDETPTVPGQAYRLRIEFPEGAFAVYIRTQDHLGEPFFPGAAIIADGNRTDGAVIWGRIMGPAPRASEGEGEGEGEEEVGGEGEGEAGEGEGQGPQDEGADDGPGCTCASKASLPDAAMLAVIGGVLGRLRLRRRR